MIEQSTQIPGDSSSNFGFVVSEAELGFQDPIQKDPFADFDFAALEAELGFEDPDYIQKQAEQALGEILYIDSEEGGRSIADVQADTDRFFSNPLIREQEFALSALAAMVADFCSNHGVNVTLDLQATHQPGELPHTPLDGLSQTHHTTEHATRHKDEDEDEEGEDD